MTEKEDPTERIVAEEKGWGWDVLWVALYLLLHPEVWLLLLWLFLSASRAVRACIHAFLS